MLNVDSVRQYFAILCNFEKVDNDWKLILVHVQHGMVNDFEPRIGPNEMKMISVRVIIFLVHKNWV